MYLHVYLVVLLCILSTHSCGNKTDLQRPFNNMERTNTIWGRVRQYCSSLGYLGPKYIYRSHWLHTFSSLVIGFVCLFSIIMFYCVILLLLKK